MRESKNEGREVFMLDMDNKLGDFLESRSFKDLTDIKKHME